MINKDGDEIGTTLNEFIDFIGDLRLVSFNAEFDMSFLKEASKPHGIVIKNSVSCALKMARRAWPDLKSYKLADLAKVGGMSSEGNHRALKDCELTVTVYMAAVSKLGRVS